MTINKMYISACYRTFKYLIFHLISFYFGDFFAIKKLKRKQSLDYGTDKV